MKKTAVLFFLIFFCLGAGRLWYWTSDGFRLARIEGFKGIGKERPFSAEAENALAQRYFYLGRGRQCFAFVSEDGKYVLKFPRLDRYNDRILFRLNFFNKESVDWRRRSHASRKEKLFDSFELSFDELFEETAIVAMFNAPKTGKEVEIFDRLNRSYRLPLEKTAFILQRKLPLFKDVFQKALSENNEVEINRILDSLLNLVVAIAKKGILTKDGSFLNNFGFDETRAYQIDVGSFYRLDGEEVFSTSIHASIETLRAWLLNLDPALLALIDRKLDPIYREGK